MKCTKCKCEISNDSKFCPKCGSKVENIGKTCPNPKCGRTGLPKDAIFCPDCRTRLTDHNDSNKNESSNNNASELKNSSDSKSSVSNNLDNSKEKESSSNYVLGVLSFIAIIVIIIVSAKSCDFSKKAVEAPEEEEEIYVVDSVSIDPMAYYDETLDSASASYPMAYYDATYLTTSQEDVISDADGGSYDISIDTDGEWEISVGTAHWGHITINGNVLTLKIDANPDGSNRNDYFTIKSGDFEKNINITQYANTNPCASIDNIWVDHNFFYNGNKGMRIHVNFLANNMKGQSVYVYAYFYYGDNATALVDPNGNNIKYYGYGTSTYDQSRFSDFTIFVPYIGLNMGNGPGSADLSFDISIKDSSGNQLARKDNTQFLFNRVM